MCDSLMIPTCAQDIILINFCSVYSMFIQLLTVG